MRFSVVSVIAQKGGVGKTTTAVHLAHGLALLELNVMAFDGDPQGQLAVSLGLEPGPGVFDLLVKEKTIEDVVQPSGRPRLGIIAGDKKTASAVNFLVIEHRGKVPLDLLRAAIKPATSNKLQWVVIDTAPTAGEFQSMAIYAADVLVIPAACDYLAEDGLVQTLETVRLAAREGVAVAVLPTFYDKRTNESERILEEYRGMLGNRAEVLKPIHACTRFREVVAEGRTIFEDRKDQQSRAAQEYAAVVRWVVKHGR